ncbi:glyoxalase [Paraburkholderia acidicola]|uniref:Glyoxalase n=1 Tax=Paraburkholderia acidicola TaxID=1912599 RepID=A0A2A4EV17_9BURK|nr:glyoxalase [Paraburkholderia acidicola]PCE24006.1 glyoxalase [Paraburkholderia acidicola]
MRILHQALRLYVKPEELERTVAFYEAIQAQPCERRIRLDSIGIEVAVVGGVIVLAGSAEALAAVREPQAAFIVDSLDEFVSQLRALGAAILHEPRAAPGGRNVTARHPDGLVVEYYQADPTA